MALRAIIFDCDGVLIDSEPLHYAALKKTLGAGEDFTWTLYKERYLSRDDRGALSRFYEDKGETLPPAQLQELIEKKSKVYEELVQTEGLLPYPAVPEFVMSVSQRYPLAIASGARRHEVELALEAAGIRPYFEAIITADDVEKGKPNPESYLKALEALNASGKRQTPIRPDECAVIEDSKDGVASAHSAGMKCIAVATSFPIFELSIADLVVPSLASLRVSQVEDLFQQQRTPAPAPAPQAN